MFSSFLLNNDGIVRIVGMVSVLFFGAAGIYGLIKLSDKTPGLVIDDEGIIENTNATSTGRIKWEDITNIESHRVVSEKFILISVKDPQKVINKATGLKKQLLNANFKTYGTPISITASTIKYNIDELEHLLKIKFKEQREKQ